MKEIIIDIKEKLNEGSYNNEEQVRLSLVARILQTLNWDIWEPQEVYTEFSPDSNNNKKVDIALFTNRYNPPIFIEIKATDKLKNPQNLTQSENQLRNYNVDLTAIFTILTDGNYWRFYFSQAGGSFEKKCFKIIEILKDDIEDIEFAFLTFLSKDEIINGNAQKEALEYLQMTRKQQIMEECLPAAKREIENDFTLNMVEALCKVVSEKGETLTKQEASDFLTTEKNKKQNKPITIQNINSASSNNQNRLTISQLETTTINSTNKQYTINNPYDLSFTKIVEGNINNERANNWQDILRVILRQLIQKNISINDIISMSTLNIQAGNVVANGFHLIPQTNYSLQNVDANTAGRAIMQLSQSYNLKLYVKFVWRDKPGQSAFPNEYCEMINN